MTQPVIRLEGVSKQYEVTGRGEAVREAVSDFTLDVEPGEFVSIIGPSGCGKTTVLFMLAGRPPKRCGPAWRASSSSSRCSSSG